MAKTPFTKLGSQDILSAHLNGLQFSINNVEDALNLSTVAITAHTLLPVIDMEDPTVRYRIYEGALRGWLNTPAPVIKRDGVVVNASEYVIQPAYGVVVFNVQQSTNVTITADITHVSNVSQRLNAIDVETAKIAGFDSRITTAQNEVDTVEGKVTTVEGKVSTVEGKVSTLEVQVASGGAVMAPLNPNLYYISNNKTNTSISQQEYITNITQVARTIDAIPFWVEYDTEIDAMRTVTGSLSSANGNIICGIYANKNAFPDTLLAETAPYNAFSSTEHVKPLLANVVLKRGMYWMARYQALAFRLDGYNVKNADGKNYLIEFERPANTLYINELGTAPRITGVRTGDLGTLTAMPAIFPALGTSIATTRYVSREQVGLIQVRAKQTIV